MCSYIQYLKSLLMCIVPNSLLISASLIFSLSSICLNAWVSRQECHVQLRHGRKHITSWGHASLMYPPGLVERAAKVTKEGTPSSLTPSLIRESEIYLPHDKNPGFSCFQMGAHLLILWGMPISRSGHRHCEHVSSATLQSTENVLILSFSEKQNPGNGTVCSYSLAIS